MAKILRLWVGYAWRFCVMKIRKKLLLSLKIFSDLCKKTTVKITKKNIKKLINKYGNILFKILIISVGML